MASCHFGDVGFKAMFYCYAANCMACDAGSILSVESNQNVESKTKNVESKIAFGQLIIRKIIKTVATRCQNLRLKCSRIQKDPAGRAYSAPQTP